MRRVVNFILDTLAVLLFIGSMLSLIIFIIPIVIVFKITVDQILIVALISAFVMWRLLRNIE